MDERDFTDQFTCDLVNEEPVAFRGLTKKEMLFVLLISLGLSIPIGLIVSIYVGLPELSLIICLISPLGSIYFLAGVVEKIRRGKPPGYFEHLLRIKFRKIISPGFIYKTGLWGLGRTDNE